MPDWLQALLLGVIQGLTEFLPVSSSGHLVIAQEALGDSFFLKDQPVLFVLALHLGTLVPVLGYYRDSLRSMLRSPTRGPSLREAGGLRAWIDADEGRRLAALVILGTIPTAIIGLAFKDVFESLFGSARPAGIALLVTGVLLMGTRFRPGGAEADAKISPGKALLIGVVQGLAITPGISRSGSTIAVALFLGLERESAARLSFLLSIPAICGAVILEARHGLTLDGAEWGPILLGFVASAAVGWAALVLLVRLVKRGGLHRFAWYVWAVGIATLALL